MLSINRLAYELVKKFIGSPEFYGVTVEKLPCGTTVIDTGLEAPGGYAAGLLTTRIAMGGAGSANLGYADFGGLKLPTVIIATDHPAIALFGAQLAGWRIKPEGYTADTSGPARALALKPKKVYQNIEYKDEADVAVLLLETEEKPPDSAGTYVAEKCGVEPENVYLVLTSTTSLAGMVQISGRIVETGLFRLDVLGLDLKKVKYAAGYAPIMPVHVDHGIAMGRAEDALTYGGVTNYVVDEEEDVLRELAEKAPSTNCKDYGKTSYEIYKAADFDFTQVDPALFAPAVITMTCAKTGASFTRGEINSAILKKSCE
ncbi:methenyltetrahydromethanopterin cyclohydrolase [Candidatus Bathyarchaeota archaeon]|nr:methenyltetrahydromethanopterin cyclohydrolase [Candidatus Bathyarchaeota archaeon]MBL7168475.1 methenyltetrahydromethanopterin cyclohydrolase [Candidatus Bathyarchaeota archaeon]